LITAFINVRLATSSDTVTLLNGAGMEPCAHAPAFAKDNAAPATARITPRRNNPASLIMYFSPLCGLEVLLATLARALETSGEFISTFCLNCLVTGLYTQSAPFRKITRLFVVIMPARPRCRSQFILFGIETSAKTSIVIRGFQANDISN
jgi:hypothetical protein